MCVGGGGGGGEERKKKGKKEEKKKSWRQELLHSRTANSERVKFHLLSPRDGYDFVSTFGGRGFSILDPSDMSRVYDSGDDFERYFTTADATEPQKAMFNAKVGSVNSPQSSLVDRESPVLVTDGMHSALDFLFFFFFSF